MKKTLTVNISGQVFHIDEDAYQLLHRYLDNLQLYLRHDSEAQQVLADIEARIATHFNQQLSPAAQVITLSDVENVIALLGENGRKATSCPAPSASPAQEEQPAQDTPSSQHETSSADDTAHESDTPSSSTTTAAPRPSKRFMRDGHNKIVGGVLSGLAAYTNTDANALRCLAILLYFILPALPIIYMVLWIACPLAQTDAQRRLMFGLLPEEPLPDADTDSLVNTPLRVVGCLFKFLILIVIFYIAFAFAIVPLLGIEGLFCWHWPHNFDADLSTHFLLIISFLMMIFIPVAYIVRFIYRRINHPDRDAHHSNTLWLVLWVISILCFVYTLVLMSGYM